MNYNPLALLHSRCIFSSEVNSPFFVFYLFFYFFLIRIRILPTQQHIRSPPITPLHLPHPDIKTALGVLAPLKSIGSINPPLAQNRNLHRNPKLYIAHHPITTPMFPVPSTPSPERELPQ
ncbi:hypothetical protein OCU04_011505 [Sclerotinia nivalis]|uniref:Uncharacterized protein n=1 Tax=Sclerotinia nivalis TaxID=352851 RepID=A0A9X0ABW0_9HELO|nr:hypothetical protein OCU04_011505 [Sclerotinia nivalis]